MPLRVRVYSVLRPFLRRHPRLKAAAIQVRVKGDLVRHSAAHVLPQLIRARPDSIFITLTANCNQRCIGCRYGRDFMPGQILPVELVRSVLEDCVAAGISDVRLYGGEPLLYKELPEVVEYAVSLRLHPWVTTNGLLLRQKVDHLYRAGLRHITLGLYGTGGEFDAYVQRRSAYAHFEEGLDYTRRRYPDIKLEFGWLLMRPTCNPDSIASMWKLAERHSVPVGVNLIHYSLPYFTEGPNRELQFRASDRPSIEAAVAQLLDLKGRRPDLLPQSRASLRSIPDWLVKGPDMRVPCDRYRLLWVGANGTVQMCYVTFTLGNLHQTRLRDMLFTAEHHQAARDGFKLNCPNCHCGYATRIQSHLPSLSKYQ